MRLAEFIRGHRDEIAAEWERFARMIHPPAREMTAREPPRFHQAVDEALTDSLNGSSAQLEQYRDQFLAILGHDLRNPLGAISMTASSLLRAEELNAKHAAMADRIVNASGRMVRLVSDLLDFTRSRLGSGIPLVKGPANLGTLCRQVLDELEATHPGRRLTLECTDGDLTGYWDGDRVAQIISNLVANALQHGDPTKPVAVRAASTGTTAILTVYNRGKAI